LQKVSILKTIIIFYLKPFNNKYSDLQSSKARNRSQKTLPLGGNVFSHSESSGKKFL
jgi:hypothetical protein